eukprot:11159428-Lingulodinium_polyedra.AAC.1
MGRAEPGAPGGPPASRRDHLAPILMDPGAPRVWGGSQGGTASSDAQVSFGAVRSAVTIATQFLEA